MNKYKIIYVCDNGYVGEENVYAANRVMAIELFESFGYEGVVSLECFCLTVE